MAINLARKHPQGIPFTIIVVVLCIHCGEHEMEMHHSASRALAYTSDEPTYLAGNICWECFMK